MAKYTVEDPTTGKSVDLEGDSPPTEQELNDIFSQVHGTSQQPQSDNQSLGQKAFNIASDTIAGSPLGMASQATNSVGQGMNWLLDKTGIPVSSGIQNAAKSIISPFRAAGVGVAETMTPGGNGIQTTQRTMEAMQPDYQPQGLIDKVGAYVGENAPAIAAGVMSPAIGGPLAMGVQQAANTGKVSPLPAALSIFNGINETKPIQKFKSVLGKGASNAVEKVIPGIPAESVENVYKKPSSLFTAPNKADVAKAYSDTEIPQNLNPTTSDIVDQGTASYSELVRQAGETLKNGDNDPATIVRGRKALDKQIAMLQNQIDIAKPNGRSALLDALKAKQSLRVAFNQFLDKIAPKFREADAIASENLKVAPFRNIALPGKINILSPEGILRAVPGLPTAIGTGIAASGALAKGIGGLLNVGPSIAPALTALTDEKAREFLKMAGKDKEKARQLAREAGYTW